MIVADFVNRAVSAIVFACFSPIAWMGPVWALAIFSAAVGLVMLLVFGRLSNQPAIRAIRERIRGNLIGVRLYQHDLGVVARIQRRLLGDTFRYIGHTLLPMAVTLIPFALILAQLNLFYSARSLRPGEAAVVTARLRQPLDLAASPKLEAAGAKVETPGVRAPARREVSWRIRTGPPGRQTLALKLGSEELEMPLQTRERWGAVATRRTGAGFFQTLLWPGAPPIPRDSAFEEISISYPRLPLTVAGWNVPWLAMFLVISIAAGFALKGAVGVEV